MIELERHIEILLLDNDCVIVPGLGGFMAHRMDARYDEQEGLFLPPYRTLGFNPQLVINDSLLVQSFIETYDISYPEALRRIEAQVEELRQHLEAEGFYELNDIGTLKLNDEGKLEFSPCEAGTLTPNLYGLSSFEMPLLPMKEIVRETPAASETMVKTEVSTDVQPQKMPHESAITIKMSWLRNMAAAAAAIIAFFMTGTPISNSDLNNNVQQSAFIAISTTDSKAVPAKEEPTASTNDAHVGPHVETQQVAGRQASSALLKEERHYCIVLASQVSKKNANNFVELLKRQGFDKAHMLETTMVRVVFGDYKTENEAYNDLQSLRTQSKYFSDAWVMKL